MTYDEWVERCIAVGGRRFRVTPTGAKGQYRTSFDAALCWLRGKGLAGTITDRVRGMVREVDVEGCAVLTNKGEPVEGVI